MSEERRIIKGKVTYDKSTVGVVNATVSLYNAGDDKAEKPLAQTRTEREGEYSIVTPLEAGSYFVRCTAFGRTENRPFDVAEEERTKSNLDIELPLQLSLNFFHYTEQDGRLIPTPYALVERAVVARVDSVVEVEREIGGVMWHASEPARITSTGREALFVFPEQGKPTITATITDKGHDGGARTDVTGELPVSGEVRTVGVSGPVTVKMERTDSRPSADQFLWRAIDERCEAIGFKRYQAHLQDVLGLSPRGIPGEFSRKLREWGARGVGVYKTVHELTEFFVLLGCGPIVDPKRFGDDPILRNIGSERQRSREEIERELRDEYLDHGELPYIRRVLLAAYPRLELHGSELESLRRRMFLQPLFLELWHEMSLEHGMVMRTMDAVCARFQNIYNSGENDGLAGLEISPLLEISDEIWDWINHAPTRLNARRRIQEYQHQYGPTVLDRNVLGIRAADVRTTFPERFMNLLSLCEEFYREDSQTTVIADAFPVLVALREVHQILAMGAGNAAPQLTFAARVESLMMKFMLAQPELRAFLHVRVMVPYEEPWEASIDAMKDLQGWRQPSISNYRQLGVDGERILLSIRLADWTAGDETNARNWLRHYRNAIRRFTYAYRAISGVELGATNEWPATRPALASSGRQGMLRGQPQARPELGFSENVGQLTPRKSNRVRQID